MDYNRIYYEFIADRRLKEADLIESSQYFEKHHIIPRSFGGWDCPTNLIALTPEDHFFAHILLAKIHGGKMMRALFAMSNLRNGCEQRPDFSKRMQYGYLRRLVAREYSENYSGIDSPISDKKNYLLLNHDGRMVAGNRFELEEQTGLTRSKISALINGSNFNCNDWYHPLTNPGKTRKELFRERSKVTCRKSHKLFHFDGRIWEGTRLQFQDEFGSKLKFQSKEGSCVGWYRTLQGAETHEERLRKVCLENSQARGDISGMSNPRADKTIYEWINFKTLERKKCTRYEISQFLKVRPCDVHALMSRRQKSLRGWGLYEVYLVKDKIKTYRKDRHGKDSKRAGI